MLDDLKKLERDGITIIVDGIEQTIHAARATLSADNLSAHMLAGFTCRLTHTEFATFAWQLTQK